MNMKNKLLVSVLLLLSWVVSAQRPVNYDESKVAPYTLEDPLTFVDGTKVKSPAEWPARRQEILGIFQKEMYGQMPPAGDGIFLEEIEQGTTLAGFATRRQVRMWFRPDKTGPNIDWLIVTPAQVKGPAPVVMFLNYSGNHELLVDEEVLVPDSWMREKMSTEDHKASPETRGKYARYGEDNVYPLGMLVANGYAVVSACYCDISPDPDPGLKEGDVLLQDTFAYTGVFDLWGERDPSRDDNTTSLAAWGWGLMRGMDMVEEDPALDASRVILTGYSRLGKAALIAGAFDERFPLVVPVQTGGGGVPLAKRNYGETVGTEMVSFRHWYCKAYGKYADNTDAMPFDQHMLLACIAPRALLVEGFDQGWFDTKGEFLSVQAASPVWKFLGDKGLPDAPWPEDFDTSAIGTSLGYVRRPNGHGISPIDWKWMLDFAEGVWDKPVTVASAGAGQHLYVSVSGDDLAEGSAASPLKTVKAAVGRAATLPGKDTVHIHIAPGTYFLDEPIVLTADDSRPMVFEGDPDDMPVLSGGFRIGGWEVTPEGWWKTRVPEVVKYGVMFQQLFVNGERTILARTPDKGLYDVIGVVDQTPVETEGKGEGYGYYVQRYATAPENLKIFGDVNSGVWADANKKDLDIRIMLFQAWDNTYKNVDYVNPDSGYVYVHGPKLNGMYRNHNRFRLENYKGALNAPGEWFLDRSGELTYIPREGEDVRIAEVYAPGMKNLLILKGSDEKPVSGKVFRNISFQHTSYLLPAKGTTPHQAAGHLDATVMMTDAEGIVLENCEIKHTGNYAVAYERARNCGLEHSFLYDLGGGGIKMDNSQGVRIVNNVIRKGGQVFPAGVGVLIRESSDAKVVHNDICDLRYSGVSVGWVWGYGKSRSFGNEIAFNHIHHLGWGELDDMGGVYTLGIQPGTTVHDNVIHDVYSHDYGGWGLYTDEGSTGIVMENNLVYACKCGGFHQHYGKDNIIRNNILAWSTWQQLQWTRIEEHRSFTLARNIVLSDGFPLLGDQEAWKKGKADFDSNCFWDITDKNPKFNGLTLDEFRKQRDPKTIVADPMFNDPLNGDFTFKSLRTARKIGFKPFDYSRAGVEGYEAWKAKARMTPGEQEDFRRVVRAGDKAYPRYYNE